MHPLEPQIIPLPGADVLLYPDFFEHAETERLFDNLRDQIQWRQEQIKFFGKTMDIPRLSALYGDIGKTYKYSGIRHEAQPWVPALLEIKSRIERIAEVEFNSVLLNFYRGERDSNGWHSDDEPELGRNPVIGSVSFGAARSFQFRRVDDHKVRETIQLENGSFLLMRGATQHVWQHQIPKIGKPAGSRINLTFRVIY